MRLTTSVTGFGEIMQLWRFFTVFGNYFEGALVVGKIVNHSGSFLILLGKLSLL